MLTNDPNIYPPVAPLPPLGTTFIDPIFNTAILRVSDAAALGAGWISTEYPPVDAFNCDRTLFVLVRVNHFQLYDLNGFVKELPIGASARPRWSRTERTVLYFLQGNTLQSIDVNSLALTALRAFSAYTAIDDEGEADISEDGGHRVLCGDGHAVFLFDMVAGTESPILDTGGIPFDSLYVTPDNNVTISWESVGAGRGQGIELFDGSGKFLRQIGLSSSHMAMTRDTNGDEVLVRTNSNDAPALDGCPNGIEKVRLSDGSRTCLLSLDWSLAVHISAPTGAGFVYVETYDAPSLHPTGGENWKVYGGELLRVWFDGRVDRLCHHRSVAWSYNGQPKATCSRDGSMLLFSSNMGRPVPADYCDVYAIAVGH